MQDPPAGAYFDPDQAFRLHSAYKLARDMLIPVVHLDEALSRKLTSALIRYARTDDRLDAKEVARLAVLHIKMMSSPIEF